MLNAPQLVLVEQSNPTKATVSSERDTRILSHNGAMRLQHVWM